MNQWEHGDILTKYEFFNYRIEYKCQPFSEIVN